MAVLLSWFLLAVAAASASASALSPRATSDDPLAACPGYKASNVKTRASRLTADLSLAGPACDVYGTDLTDLTLEVVYETGRSARCNPPPRPSSPPPPLNHALIKLQMIEFMSRSKMQPTAFIKFQLPFLSAPRPLKASILKKPTSNSTTRPLRSRSRSLEQIRVRFYSILPLQASSSSLSISGFAPRFQITRISMG